MIADFWLALSALSALTLSVTAVSIALLSPATDLPGLEAISTMDCGPHGGNLDVQEFAPGTRVFLPVAVDGALLFVGDCHAVQGDGELAGFGATATSARDADAPSPFPAGACR